MTVQISARTIAARGMDFGVSVDGPDLDPFAEALCVGRWQTFDVDYREGSPEAARLAQECARCPVFEACKKRARETDQAHGFHGFIAGKTADERRHERFGDAGSRVEEVRRLHSRGFNDWEVGRIMGISKKSAANYRRLVGLPVIEKEER